MSVHETSTIYKHVDLPPTQKAILLKVGDNASDAGFAWPSVARIAHETGYSARIVKRALKEFVAAGILEIRANEKGGRARPRVYWINLQRVQEVHPLPKFEPTGFEPFGPAKGESHDAKGESRDTKGCTSCSPEPSGTIKEPSGEPSLARADTERHDDLDHFELTTAETHEDMEHASKRSRRPTRLAANWEPGDWDFAYGRDRGFHDAEITDHAANFKTHFTAGRGRNTTHLRWSGDGNSAFASWLRRERPRQLGPGPGGPGGGKGGRDRPGLASVVAAVNRLQD